MNRGQVYSVFLSLISRYVFVEDVQNPFSCTILLKGPNSQTVTQLKDAVHDGIRSVKVCQYMTLC